MISWDAKNNRDNIFYSIKKVCLIIGGCVIFDCQSDLFFVFLFCFWLTMRWGHISIICRVTSTQNGGRHDILISYCFKRSYFPKNIIRFLLIRILSYSWNSAHIVSDNAPKSFHNLYDSENSSFLNRLPCSWQGIGNTHVHLYAFLSCRWLQRCGSHLEVADLDIPVSQSHVFSPSALRSNLHFFPFHPTRGLRLPDYCFQGPFKAQHKSRK